jgi:hypothetical protein
MQSPICFKTHVDGTAAQTVIITKKVLYILEEYHIICIDIFVSQT